jgi:phosphoesterase RecJ-like protein
MSREQFVAAVRAGNRFLVTCHRRPDADALGSAMGFTEVLRMLGKEAVLCSPDEPPATLTFLPGLGGLERSFAKLEGRFDATIVMDTASASLLPKGLPGKDIAGTLIVLDHHAAYDDFADIVVREPAMSSTGELVLELSQALGVFPRDLNIVAATALYAALVADTGGFRYSSTRPRTLRLAADLLDVGVDPWTVAYNLFEGWAPERVALLREVLAGMELRENGRVALLTVTKAILERTRATPDMIDGLITFARQVRGVEVAALIWEQDAASSDLGKEPSTKVSLRASGRLDVSKVAVALGGGGHRAAAAATLGIALDATRARLLAELAALTGA